MEICITRSQRIGQTNPKSQKYMYFRKKNNKFKGPPLKF